jgi:rod shape-determining protein MreC
MQQIINFLIKNRNVLLLMALVFLGLTFTIQNHTYHRSSFVHSANEITGSLLGTRASIYHYFNLDTENDLLRKENAALRMALALKEDKSPTPLELSIKDSLPFHIIPARIVKNDYSRRDNFLTIDEGSNAGIKEDMGVITTNGILGIVDKTSSNHSRVISILNSEISLNAQIKGTNTIGSLTWDGSSPYYMSLIDVPRLANVTKGDTIVTGRQSVIFPHNIGIGLVEEARLIENGGKYQIRVKLFNDMTQIGTAYAVENTKLEEIKKLESQNNE